MKIEQCAASEIIVRNAIKVSPTRRRKRAAVGAPNECFSAHRRQTVWLLCSVQPFHLSHLPPTTQQPRTSYGVNTRHKDRCNCRRKDCRNGCRTSCSLWHVWQSRCVWIVHRVNMKSNPSWLLLTFQQCVQISAWDFAQLSKCSHTAMIAVSIELHHCSMTVSK